MYKLVLAISLVWASVCLGADTAEDYFHRGAQYYIWGQKQKATGEIAVGLAHFPSDPQLNGLAALLKKEAEQEQQQSQQNQQSKSDQNQQQQKQQNQQQKSDSSQQNQQSQPQKPQDQQQQQASNQSPDQKDKQQQSASSGQKQDKSDDKNQEQPPTAYAAGQMTPEQAQQLLDAQKGDEQLLQLKPEGKPVDNSRAFKDW